MNQSNGEINLNRRWWQGWFTDWSLCGPDRVNAIKATVWTAAFCVLFAISTIVIDTSEVGGMQTLKMWQWILTLAPVVPGLIAIPAWIRFMKNAEELLRRIYFEAAGTGFCVGLVLFAVLGVIGRIFGNSQGREAMTLAFCLMVFAFAISLQYKLRKFNE